MKTGELCTVLLQRMGEKLFSELEDVRQLLMQIPPTDLTFSRLSFLSS